MWSTRSTRTFLFATSISAPVSFRHLLHFSLGSAQVASGGDESYGQVEIFSLNRPTPRSVKSFLLASPALSIEYVTEASTEENEGQVSEGAARIGNTICVGLQDGKWVQLWN